MPENINIKTIFDNLPVNSGQTIEEGTKSVFYTKTFYYECSSSYEGNLIFEYYKDSDIILTETINKNLSDDLKGYEIKKCDRVNIKYENTSVNNDNVTLIIIEYQDLNNLADLNKSLRKENTETNHNNFLALGGYRDSTRTVSNEKWGALSINDKGQLETEIKNTSINISSSTLATESTLEDVKTKLTSIDGNITSCDTSGLATQSTLEDVKTSLQLIDNTIGVEDQQAPTNMNLVGGRYSTTLRTLDDGDIGAVMIGEDGAQVTRTRCKEQNMPNDFGNNNRELPLSCNGGYVQFPTLPYVYNDLDNRWYRIPGTIDGITTNNSLRIKREQQRCYISSMEGFSTSDTNLLTLYNPSGSGIDCFLYNIEVFCSASTSSPTTSLLTFKRITAHSSGTDITPQNLYLGSATSSNAESKKECSITSAANLFYLRHKIDSTVPFHFKMDDIQEEIIQIPEGQGVCMEYSDNDTDNINFSCTFRWYEQ